MFWTRFASSTDRWPRSSARFSAIRRAFAVSGRAAFKRWAGCLGCPRRNAPLGRPRREGLTGFQFTGQERTGRLVPAAPRPEYLPVFFVEPYRANRAIAGFDLGSNPRAAEDHRGGTRFGKTGDGQSHRAAARTPETISPFSSCSPCTPKARPSAALGNDKSAFAASCSVIYCMRNWSARLCAAAAGKRGTTLLRPERAERRTAVLLLPLRGGKERPC